MRTGIYRHVVVALIFFVAGCSHGGGGSTVPHVASADHAPSSLQCGVIPLSHDRTPHGIGPCCNMADGELCSGAVNMSTAPGWDQYPNIDGCDSLNSGFQLSGGNCYGTIGGAAVNAPIGFSKAFYPAISYSYDSSAGQYVLDVANPLGSPALVSFDCSFQTHNPNYSGASSGTFKTPILLITSAVPQLAAYAHTSCNLRSGSQSWVATGVAIWLTGR